jgi:predicted nucleic acid-binding Zn ribbon protein
MVSCPDHPCPICKGPMTGRQKSACSGKCRAELSRFKRKEEALAALVSLEVALRTLRRVWGAENTP